MQDIAINTWTELSDQLKRFVYQKVKDKAIAEDIVQDVFLKIYSKASQVKDSEKIQSWIYQVTRNTIADHFRRVSKTLNPVDVDWADDYNEFNDCVAFCLKELIKSLPDKYRIALEMSENEQLSQIEIAKRLSVSYSGAKSRVQRARKLLREKLQELYLVQTDSRGNVIVCEDKVDCGCDSYDQVRELNMKVQDHLIAKTVL